MKPCRHSYKVSSPLLTPVAVVGAFVLLGLLSIRVTSVLLFVCSALPASELRGRWDTACVLLTFASFLVPSAGPCAGQVLGTAWRGRGEWVVPEPPGAAWRACAP